MDTYLIGSIAGAAALALLWWLQRRQSSRGGAAVEGDRLDTLTGWAPEATRILRTSERLAYSTLKLALPGYMILAQVPIARFINVPKRNSYAEWMRRLGSQCVDFVVCDVTSQVVAIVDVRPPAGALSERLQRRLDRVARTMEAVRIPLHVWNEEALPSVESARADILRDALPPIPAEAMSRKAAAGLAAAVAVADARMAFADTDRDLSREHDVEVIEMREPIASTWFDELDSVPSTLPPPTGRNTR